VGCKLHGATTHRPFSIRHLYQGSKRCSQRAHTIGTKTIVLVSKEKEHGGNRHVGWRRSTASFAPPRSSRTRRLSRHQRIQCPSGVSKDASAPCDVLLLCYSMDINVRQRLTRGFREHCPDGRIIANYEPASGEASGGCGGFPLWCRRSRVAPRNTARADGRTESRRLGPLADNQTPVARPVTVAQYVAAQNINNFYACFTDRSILARLKSPGFANYFVAEQNCSDCNSHCCYVKRSKV
jgi:hypothetical protein